MKKSVLLDRLNRITEQMDHFVDEKRVIAEELPKMWPENGRRIWNTHDLYVFKSQNLFDVISDIERIEREIASLVDDVYDSDIEV